MRAVRKGKALVRLRRFESNETQEEEAEEEEEEAEEEEEEEESKSEAGKEYPESDEPRGRSLCLFDSGIK